MSAVTLRKLKLGALLAGAVALLTVASASGAPNRVPMEVMIQPNAGGDHLSIDSGLAPVRPCEGAAEALQPTWLAAANTFGLRWQILAAITKIESGFGCNMGPSSAGAVGWTQFMPATWDRWGMDADGDGTADPQNSVDAVFSTARYLKVTGAPEDYRKAIFAYNHADWYVDDVLETAGTFGELSGAQFKELAELTRKGKKLRNELSGLQERLEDAEDREDQLDGRVKDAKKKLQDGEQELADSTKAYGQAKVDLNQATLEYISLTQGVAMGDVAPEDSETALLEYMVNSRPEDAALVYQSARGLMNRQTEVLDDLRVKAEDAGDLEDRMRDLVAERERLVEQRRDDLAEQRELIDLQRGDIAEAQAKLAKFKKTERRYQRMFSAAGGGGSLLTGPFAGMVADRDLRGKLRWPVTGSIVSPFNPNRCLGGICRPHEGVDIAVPSGTPVHAPAAGTVSFAGEQSGYGNIACVNHGGGVETCSAHMTSIDVTQGEPVRKGRVLGMSGCTGRCFGPHVHFEVRISGVAQDPMRYLP